MKTKTTNNAFVPESERHKLETKLMDRNPYEPNAKKKFSIVCLECGNPANIEQTKDENRDGDFVTDGYVVRCTSCPNAIWSIDNGEI